MLEDHLSKLIAAIEEAVGAEKSARGRFDAFVQVYVQKSAQSRRRHVTAMNDVKFLPKALQQPILALERRLIERITALLDDLNPSLGAALCKPYAMLLLGMVNWTDFWYRPTGPLKPPELCDRISRLFLKGFLAEKPAS